MPKLGMYHYKVDVQLQDYSQYTRLVKFIDEHHKIMYRDVTLKHADIEFELYVRSVEELHGIMDELRSHFKGAIGTYVYYLFKKLYKINYFPI
ncbi:hypothetical protein J4211_04605 [Candidatus Woesearchaeota archaeon]|nr:hypothetical protein [Candidatus Woesearchaeota archaeon]